MVKARKMEKTSQDVQVHPNQMYARGNDKDACMTVQMNFELVGEDGLWFGRLDVVPAEAPVGTHAGRLGQCVRSVGVSLPFELSDSMNCLMQHLLQTSISLKLVLIKHYTVASLGFDGPPEENACPSSVSSRPKLSLARPWVLECRVGRGRRAVVRSSGRGSNRSSNREARMTARSVCPVRSDE
ncbi:hypothetical protein F2Q70_00015710 [Brassica cretica]|uniref:Uncharacterized protein n=1 Tax=Brassica cretica TaxID=69181 RepID=A0A8S9HZF3_BRACR|nr:hypothetical protein F2Q70_00015710 [Brassica cretica]